MPRGDELLQRLSRPEIGLHMVKMILKLVYMKDAEDICFQRADILLYMGGSRCGKVTKCGWWLVG